MKKRHGKGNRHPHREVGGKSPHHIGKIHRGDAMHLTSHAGNDGKAHGVGGTAGSGGSLGEMGSLSTGYSPPEEYQGGADGPNSTCC
jgi:hypothetical protein